MHITSMESNPTKSQESSLKLAAVANLLNTTEYNFADVKLFYDQPAIPSKAENDRDVLASIGLLMLDKNLSDPRFEFKPMQMKTEKESEEKKVQHHMRNCYNRNKPMLKRSKNSESSPELKSQTVLYDTFTKTKKKRSPKINSDEEEDWEDEKKPNKRKKKEDTSLDSLLTAATADSEPETPKKRRSRVKTENRVRNPPKKWNEQDDVKLQSLVSQIPECNNRWTQIGEQLGRSPSECFQHWMRVLNPNINKGPWNLQEEECLYKVIGSAGSKVHWAKVAEKIPGRTDTQCRYQWTRIKRSEETPWLDHEDHVLHLIMRDAVEDTLNWTEIANMHYKHLLKNHQTKYKTPPRPAIHCRRRWSELGVSRVKHPSPSAGLQFAN